MVNSRSLARGVVKWKGLLFGAAMFLATYAVIFAKWGIWFGGPYQPPWFLNDGDGPVVFTAVSLFVASAAVTAMWAARDDAPVYGVNVAVGACIAMIVAICVIGPGTLFPIVIALGGFIIGTSSVAGSLMVWSVKRVLRSA